jgi:serine/threonine protein kinase
MICPRCSVGEISETTQECLVCGFSPTGGVMVDSADYNRLDDPVIVALDRQFQVEGVLRRGAASHIYLARDQVSGRLCSLKVLPLAPYTATSVTERFRQDAQRAANLDHPHLVAVDRFGVTDTALWYAMDYVQGRSLGDLLPTADRMDLKTCLRLLEQVASALDYGHRRGMVHGNLKPSNVLVDPEGWVRVADFGVNGAFGALPRRQPELSYEENYGHVAPEQFGANGEVGPAADQYALAVLAFSCLARRLPFAGDTLEEITLQHLEGPVPFLAETRPELPEYVSTALARAMSRHPDERFASVLDLATALAGVPLPKPSATATSDAVSAETAPSPQPEAPREPVDAAPATEPAAEARPAAAEPEEQPKEQPADAAPAAPETEEIEEEEEEERQAEPATPGPPQVPASEAVVEEAEAVTEMNAEPEVPAEASPAHPPLLFIERHVAAGDDDDDDEDEAERAVAPVPAHDDDDDDTETKRPDRKSREPVLLWRASREHAAPATSAVAGGPKNGGDGESPDAAPPLLFRDKSTAPPRRVWQDVVVQAMTRVGELTGRWRALPRNTRIGSGAGAGVLMLVLALVWWRVARGHAEDRPGWVAAPAPAALGDSTPAQPGRPRTETPPSRRSPRSATPAVPSAPKPASSGSTGGGGSAPANAADPAHLYLNATPWGRVFIDDKLVGNTPMADFQVTPGYHVIRIDRDGYQSFTREIAIESGEALRLTDIVLQEKPQ